MRSENFVCHRIGMTTYLAQHWISCISLKSAAPNFKKEKMGEATEEGKMPKLR